MAATSITAIVGDYVPPLLTYGPAHVHPRCTITPPLAHRRYACLSCRVPLANSYQLDAHLETGADQPHVIARECPEHGWETL